MPQVIKTRVLIVGGGPVGMTLALDLAWRGIDVIVAERRPADDPPSVANSILKVAASRAADRMDVVQLTKGFTRAAEVTMITSAQSDEIFDYQATAELFTGKNIRVRSRNLKYMRFNHAADAIRFAIEQLQADVLSRAYLEVNEERYDNRGIRRLYESVEYPFTRLAKVA